MAVSAARDVTCAEIIAKQVVPWSSCSEWRARASCFGTKNATSGRPNQHQPHSVSLLDNVLQQQYLVSCVNSDATFESHKRSVQSHSYPPTASRTHWLKSRSGSLLKLGVASIADHSSLFKTQLGMNTAFVQKLVGDSSKIVQE